MSRSINSPPQSPLLPDGTRRGGWWHEAAEGNRIVCDLCPRECVLKPGDRGFCFVRENRAGEMVLNTYGRSTGFCIDPIEKKPLNHFYPGSSVLSFGTAGCNLGCKFCQNHDISKAREVALLSERATPEMIAAAANEHGCQSVAYTYNDPVVWAEYAIDTAKACHEVGVKNVAVTAGYITPEARGAFYEHIDAANIDLKAFSEQFYYQLTLSHLQPVLDTITWLKRETDVWVEITTLLIPDENDSDEEIRRMCDWLLDHAGDQTPIHFSAFHPDFRMLDKQRTPVETLLRAHEVARQAGLQYVYVGNVHAPEYDATYCHSCGKQIIARDWYELGAYHLKGNRCAHCGTEIPGRFAERPGNWGRKRLPVKIAQFDDAAPRSPTPADEDQLVQITPMADNKSSTATTPSKKDSDMSSSTEHSSSEAPRTDHLVPQLDKRQQRQVHDTACELVAAEVLRRQAHLDDCDLGELARFPLLGAFVTLRREGKLRACCGMIGRTAPLGEVLHEAARRTATEDTRLPTISPTELEYLDLDVWLLYNPQDVMATGRDRIGAVTIGQHGLQVARGNQRGLLLPGVATELGLDSEQFLQQVCLKAGLPPTAWLDDQTQLSTFEGLEIAAPFHLRRVDADLGSTPDMFSEMELAALANFCRQNIKCLLEGSTPNYYLFGVADGEVNSLAISISRPGAAEPIHYVRLSLRPGMPLQTSLFGLTETAAKNLAAQGIFANQVDALTVDVSIFHDPAMHGTATEPDLRGFEPAGRALLVMERGRSAWLVNREHAPQELLKEAIEQASLMNPAAANVYSLEVQTTRHPLSIVIGQQASAGAAIRPPAVAGTFYPAEPAALEKLVSELLPAQPTERREVAAVMIPHAGLVYSGKIAAEVLSQVEPPDTVIVIGPKHTPHGVDWAVAPHGQWSLPTGQIPSDQQLAGQLAEAIEHLQLDAAAHAREHAIEVELPLIQRLAPAAKVVGIVIGRGGPQQCRHFARSLARVIGSRSERILLAISSDMNHFADDQETRRLDEMALSALEALDSEVLYTTCRSHNISMCGLLPAVIVLETLKELGKLNRAQRVSYGTSADVSGDTSRVVGYAGLLFE